LALGRLATTTASRIFCAFPPLAFVRYEQDSTGIWASF
jgi:hypothetical protein